MKKHRLPFFYLFALCVFSRNTTCENLKFQANSKNATHNVQFVDDNIVKEGRNIYPSVGNQNHLNGTGTSELLRYLFADPAAQSDIISDKILSQASDPLQLELLKVISSWTDLVDSKQYVELSRDVLPLLASVAPYADMNGILSRSSKHQKNTTGELPVVSASCVHSIRHLASDLYHKQQYVFKMLDAFGKLPSGLAQGDLQWLGAYDECRSIKQTYIQRNVTETMQGKYCMTAIGTPKSGYAIALNFGICVPESCSEEDMQTMLDNFLHTILPVPLYEKANPLVYCTHEPELYISSYLSIVFIAVVCVMLLIGSSYDVISNNITRMFKAPAEPPVVDSNSDDVQLLSSSNVQEDGTETCVASAENTSKFHQIVLSFSAFINASKILSTSVRGGDSFLGMLNGMRVLSMWWVMFGHTLVFQIGCIKNVLVFKDLVKRFTFQVVLQAPYSVDSFFFLSGLLVSYLTLKQLHRHDGSLNWFMFYFHRIWRLTPLYIFVLLFFMGLLGYIIEGPAATLQLQNPTVTSCYKYWWANLLYINNFIPGRELNMCMDWVWYLANDMQFFCISPIFIYLLYRWRNLGFLAILLTLAFSFTLTGVMAHLHNATGLMVGVNMTNLITPYNDYLYIQPYYRISPYLVGIVLGYILYKTKGIYRMNWISVVVGWSLSTILGMLLIYGFYYNYHNSVPLNAGLDNFHTACGRCAWAVVLAWICFSCAHGYGGPVNRFLSWRAWSPLSRLTYAAYLVHPIVMMVYYTQQRTPLYYTDINVSYTFISHMVVSYCVAFVASILVESPMMALEKVVFARWR